MKELKLPSEKKSKLEGKKKFIAVLAACAIAVLVAGYIAVDKSLTYTRPVEEPQHSSEAEKVDKQQQGVVEKPEPASSAVPESSAEDKPANTVPEPTLLIWPVEGGTLLREYSADALVFSPTMQDWRTHNGIDVAAPVGTAVRAMAAGKVTSIREDDMLGWVIEIAHGSYVVSYCNVQEGIAVKEGDTVGIGDTIGGVGQQARLEIGDEPHIHLEVRRNGELIDPLSVMNNTDIE
ncbi:MAG: M23 family metallopeptidase [Clostridia bacterium]|nr:M23 family metallopeptidase [Clostridia bacterium]MBR4439520.1 M23 family metallopeptidase [Clostridia bacterium]MBR5942577.1 M23 family metallopeptidase [Clostridia bacterium]